MAETDVILNAPAISTLEAPARVHNLKSDLSVAFVRDEKPTPDFALITPNDVKTLVDNQITVFMQHGFSNSTAYSDMEYANVGVEFVDDFATLCSMSKTLVKFQPFTEEQLSLLKDNQILFSKQTVDNVAETYAQLMKEKHTTAFGLNLIKEADGRSTLKRLLSEVKTGELKNVVVSSFVLPLLMSLLFSPRLRFALQRDPVLMNCVYCFEGSICNFEMAQKLNIPYKDILSLCWDLN